MPCLRWWRQRKEQFGDVRAVLDFSLTFQSAIHLVSCRPLGGGTELRARDERVGAVSFTQQPAGSRALCPAGAVPGGDPPLNFLALQLGDLVGELAQ